MDHFTEEQRESIFKEMGDESDRSCAIVGLSVIEPLVKTLLLKKLAELNPKEPRKKLVEAFKSLTDLGRKLDGFVPQCTLLYLIGSINDMAYQELKTMAKVRNKFAHNAVLGNDPATATQPTFTSDGIGELCHSLKMPNLNLGGYTISKHFEKDNPRDRFLFSVMAMSVFLSRQISKSSESANLQANTNTATLDSKDSSGQISQSDAAT